MKAPNEIESVAQRMQFEPDVSTDRRVLTAAEAALANRTQTTRVVEARAIWRQTMKNPMARLAIAAAVIVAALLGIHFFTSTSDVAWAAVLEKVKNANSYVYRVREVETTGPRPDGFEFATEKETTIYHSETFGVLHDESYMGEKHIAKYYWLLQTNEYVGVCYPLEEYERLPLREGWRDTRDDRDPKQAVVRVLEGDSVAVGRDMIAGRTVEGIQMNDPSAFSRWLPAKIDHFMAHIWIDVETALPVWVEIGFTPKDSDLQTTIVMDQFQWGVPLDASLFEPNIPAHFALDYTDKPRPDSVPKTEPAQAFADNSEAEPYLGDFDHLDLPDVNELTLLSVDASASAPRTRLTTRDQVWQLQDQFVAKWPAYDEVQLPLRQELADKLAIDQLGVEELVTTGIALRERFWELGGDLSEVSYPYAYAARIVTEIAHERAPEDMAVTDQLIESITTYELMWVHDPDPNAWIRNPIYPGLLTELRLEQFEQIKRAVAEGQVPTWKDFVRAEDLVFLLNTRRRDYAGALEVTRWLIDQAETAGWSYYLDRLKRMEQTLMEGDRYVAAVFMNAEDVYPEGFRYGRRLCSFQGPRQMRRVLLPIHLRHLKGW